MYLRGCSELATDALLFEDVTEGCAFMSWLPVSCAASFSRSRPDSEELLATMPVPGVFGVLAAEPKDAKAPDPKPKAEEAPAVGEATLEVVKGVMPLREVLLPDVPSPPYRLVAENVREVSSLACSLAVEEVVVVVLLELRFILISRSFESEGEAVVDQLRASLPQIVHEDLLSCRSRLWVVC